MKFSRIEAVASVVMLVGDRHAPRRIALITVFVVGHQLAQHVARTDKVLVIVLDGLELGDLADGMDGAGAQLPYPFRQLVDGGENLGRLVVEQQMIVAEMRPRDMRSGNSFLPWSWYRGA